MSTQPLIELNNGIQIPQLGFGTFRVSVEETQKVTEEALAVFARYTRRGGLDINPFRSSGEFAPPANIREVRQ